jgi:hypothetical protein
MRRVRRDDRTNVYVNSTNTYFPTTITCLRAPASLGVWCFDMHDDLRYHNTGLKRWRESRVIALPTDIPQARIMAKHLHVVSDVPTCAETLAAIQAGELAKQPAYTPITLEQRADRLVEIIRARPWSRH